MKNFLAILGCFSLAVIMIVVFASCGRKGDVTVTDPDDGIVEQATETDSGDNSNKNEEADEKTTEADSETQENTENATSAGTSSTGSSFLDTVLGGVEDVVGEALGGAANVVEEALSGAADKVNSALNDENKNN